MAFGFEAVEINSALISAQNRQRLYWVGRRNADGSYSRVRIPLPIDRGIVLRDILDSGIAWNEKSYALTTRCMGAIPSDTLKRHRHTMVAEPLNEPVRIGTNGWTVAVIMHLISNSGAFAYAQNELQIIINKESKNGKGQTYNI